MKKNRPTAAVNQPKEEVPVAIPDPALDPAAVGSRQAVLATLQAAASRQGWVDATVPEIARRTGLPVAGVIKQLRGLHDKGMLKFGGPRQHAEHVNDKDIRRIRLVAAGLHAVVSQPVAVDKPKDEPKAVPEPKVERKFPYPSADPRDVAYGLAQELQKTSKTVAPPVAPAGEPVMIEGVTVDLAEYPLVTEVIGRGVKVAAAATALTAAAEALRAAGRDATSIELEALQLAETGPQFTPLETEVKRLIEALGLTP